MARAGSGGPAAKRVTRAKQPAFVTNEAVTLLQQVPARRLLSSMINRKLAARTQPKKGFAPKALTGFGAGVHPAQGLGKFQDAEVSYQIDVVDI